MSIHPTAVVDPAAKVPSSCTIGPYCVIGAEVEMGQNCELIAHVVLGGPSRLGSHNKIYPFASLGMGPQDISYRGEPTLLEIGDRNIIREFATLNPGTAGGGMVTTVGSDTLLMNYAHVGHDCHVGSHCVLANSATLAGHVTLEDYVIVGGLAAIHQFVRIGESAILGGGAMVEFDVPPFCNASGDRARLRGLNLIGLKRRGFAAERVRAIKGAYRLLFGSGMPFAEARARVAAELDGSPDVERLLAFLAASSRGVTPAARGRGGASSGASETDGG